MDKVFGSSLRPGDPFKIRLEGSVYIVYERVSLGVRGAGIACRHGEKDQALAAVDPNKEYLHLGPSELDAHTTHPGFIRHKEA